jgi:pimeloyl-ACP methyl ester carboxylesterase
MYVMTVRKIFFAWILFLAAALFVSGCATPVGVRRVTPRAGYQNATANPISEAVLSENTKVVLNRFYLYRKFQKNPAAAIAALHEKGLFDDRRDIRYALAEVCYLYGDQLQRSFLECKKKLASDYFILSAFYAYLYILDDMREQPPAAFDQRFRTACDLYNFSLWRALSKGREGRIEPPEGNRVLPVGSLVITLNKSELPPELEGFDRFVSSYKYAVRGITVRNRTAGMGLPLIGLKKNSKDSPLSEQSIAVTAFLRIQGGLRELSAGTASASLELYSVYDDAVVVVNNRTVPLEADTTAPTAYILEHESFAWDFGLKAFLGKLMAVPNSLYSTQPYQPGRIPVVFVHGTTSSPVWWTEMWNTLRADPELRSRYQFWFFMYNSGIPSTLSAADFRDRLKEHVTMVDPEGRDPALGQMVVVGHSQGGLLAKLTAVETGDRLLRSIFDKDIDDMKAPDETKAMLRHAMLVEPLPFVKRVVFISTPHRGSFRSSSWVRKIMRKLIKLPANIVQIPFDMYDYVRDDLKNQVSVKIPNSLDSMSPDNPLLKTLADISLAPGVKGHSIIAVKNPKDPREQWNDGVVEYKSAHLEGMESEFILEYGHSSQGHPLTIEEVRRILLEHLKGLP